MPLALFTTRLQILDNITQNTKILVSNINSVINELNGKVSSLQSLSTGQDFNTVTKTGVYRFNNNHPNMPSGYNWGQLFVGHGGGDTIFQFVVGFTAGYVYPAIRCGNPPELDGAGQWTPWFKCSLMNMDNRTIYPNGTQLWIE